MYKRDLSLKESKTSFFLWGQRQTGKSSLLKAVFPQALWLDLLDSKDFLDFSARPYLLRERTELLRPHSVVIIDEVQKVPLLLDEVQNLIERRKLIFGLCGSSARKLKRGHGNLLGGRARRFELYGFTSNELGKDFSLNTCLNRGYLPPHYLSEDYLHGLQSYVTDYLKEEIIAEGLTRNVQAFSRFLEAAALGDGEVLNYSTFARDTGVSLKTVQSHFDILVDTLTGAYLPAYTKRTKRRVRQAPKFYFHDVGIVNFLARRKHLEPRTPDFGRAFENWVHHELTCCLKYLGLYWPMAFWRLTSGAEVDFILGEMEIAIEAKASDRIHADHLKGLREIKKEFPGIRERVVVCLEAHARMTEDRILVLPYQDFAKALWEGGGRELTFLPR